MLYREIIAFCSQIHKDHINTLCGLNVELLNVKLAVHIGFIKKTGRVYRYFSNYDQTVRTSSHSTIQPRAEGL